jgi:hypothetical protein
MDIMSEYIRSNIQILGICALVLAVLLVRIAASLRSGRREISDGKHEDAWRKTFARCEASGSFALKDMEISRFAINPMLRAFGRLAEAGAGKDCAAILRENSRKITARLSTQTDNAKKGYFAYILAISDLSELPAEQRTEYIGFVRPMLSNHSIFCRENALKALYNLGDADAVAEAVEKLSADAHLHNEKLLSDGMNSFRGDRAKLAEALMERFERYDDHSQSAIITFFTVAGFHDWDAFFKERLAREEISIDQRCDILRLLMKVPSADTKRILIDTLREKGKAEDWQTAAVAATGLSCYPDDAETVEALRYGITSPAWSVRKNCAAALVKLRAPREVLDGILCGEDAYARDALRFALDQREDQTEGEKE